ncbi:hypothetical protein [Candidatus Poriferisocius sp.]|uniref:hypothetical protein n=1 Tax=Candidatus Poriferisocius sp. TaxID=3101276 RepID=UPI003B51C8EF
MNAVIYSTLIGVLGGGLVGLVVFQFRTITGALNRLADQFRGLEDKFMDLQKEVHDGFKEHGESLARIETKLDINPPAEAA